MIERLEAVEKRYNEIINELSKPEVLSDIKLMTTLSKEQTSLEKQVEIFKKYKKVLEDIEACKEMMKDIELGEFALEEYSVLVDEKEKLEHEL